MRTDGKARYRRAGNTDGVGERVELDRRGVYNVTIPYEVDKIGVDLQKLVRLVSELIIGI